MSQILLQVLGADEKIVGKQIFNAGTTCENYKKEEVVRMIELALVKGAELFVLACTIEA